MFLKLETPETNDFVIKNIWLFQDITEKKLQVLAHIQ